MNLVTLWYSAHVGGTVVDGFVSRQDDGSWNSYRWSLPNRPRGTISVGHENCFLAHVQGLVHGLQLKSMEYNQFSWKCYCLASVIDQYSIIIFIEDAQRLRAYNMQGSISARVIISAPGRTLTCDPIQRIMCLNLCIRSGTHSRAHTFR